MNKLIFSSIKRAFLCGCAALSLTGCATQRQPSMDPSVPSGPILFSREDGTLLSAQELSNKTEGADYIIIGEQHTVAQHHQAQARLLELLAQNKQCPVLGMEMFPAVAQHKLTPFNERRLSVLEFEEASDWANVWGYNFAIYQPIFEVAQYHNIPVYGLNISKETLNSIRQFGLAEAKKSTQDIPDTLIMPHPEQQKRLKAFYDKTRAMMEAAKQKKVMQTSTKKPAMGTPKEGMKPDFDRFLLVQALWDSTMAENAVRVRTFSNRPVVIIAGSAHASPYGIAWRLQQMDPNSRIVRVQPTETFPPSEEYAADFYFKSPEMDTMF